MFKATSFNANSVRVRLGAILDWLAREKPDVLCLQETKAEDKNFPLQEFENAGYYAVFKGQKSYNGVAIISPHPIEEVRIGLGEPADPAEARLICGTIKGLPVVNTYVPQGFDPKSEIFAYKLKWIRAMRDYFNERYSPAQPLLWMGDFNVAPEPLDVYNPDKLLGHVGYHPEEHEALNYVKKWGFVDVFRLHVREGGHFSFWDYRVPRLFERNLGWRIDHIWATEPLAARSRRAWIDKGPRAEVKPSDHTFIAAEFAW